MQITGPAIVNVQKISGFLNALYNQTAKVNIALMGDSTTIKDGHGWDSGVPDGLMALGLRRFGTGIISAGEELGNGHGSSQPKLNANAVPNGITNNGFTASLPSEWAPYLSNWGTAEKPLLTQDSNYTYLGSMRPYCMTAGMTGPSSNNSFRYTVNGVDGLYNFNRPFEGITSDLVFQHWYLKRDTVTAGGSVSGIYLLKNSWSGQAQTHTVLNFDGVTAFARGTTFTFTFGLTTTSPIGLTSDNTNFRSAIASAITGAGFSTFVTDSDKFLVTSATNVLFSGDLSIVLPFNTSVPSSTINVQGLTGRYYDAIIGYPQGVTTQFNVRGPGTFFSSLNSASGLSESGKTLNATRPFHLELATYSLGASAARDYNIGLLWQGHIGVGGGMTGPWCSMFSGCTISGSTAGFATTTLMYMGGLGAGAHARAVKNQSYDFLGTMFQALAQHAGYTSAAVAPLLIRLAGGINDVNDAALGSTGPSGGLSGNTRAGIRDNWQGIINHVHAAYAYHGWTASNLYWLITPSPQTEIGNANLNPAVLAAQDVSNNNSRVASVDPSLMVTSFTGDVRSLDMRTNLTGGTDIYHHSSTGYRVYSYYEWASIQQAYNTYTANNPPVARISYSPSTIYADQFGTYADNIVVSGLSSTDDGSISSYVFNWTSLSGATSTTVAGGTASISLPTGLTNNVTLIVVDNAGATGATSINIPVLANRAPTASFNANPGFSTFVGLSIAFTSTSTDPGAGGISGYSWSVTPGSQTGSGSIAGFTFGATGTYTVRLTVTDNLGATGTTTGTVTVSSGASGSSIPTARILVSPASPLYDHDGNSSEVFVLSATASTVVGASIQNYLWSNGSTGTTTSITVPIGITYPSLLITDTLGATSATSTSLTVFANPAPTAIITVTPNATVTDTDGDGMETLIVSGLNSYDQGTGTIATYQWNTGSTGATFSQAFSVTGSPHTVWLIVGDNVGATTYISQQIIVRAKTRGPGSASNGSTVWFAGKLYTQEQYIQILQAFYPNLIR